VTDDFQRYLRAKRTVDDRALDRRLLARVSDALEDRAGSDGRLSVLEVGAGIGTMITRFIERDILPAADIQYTAVDVQQSNLDTLPGYLRTWADGRPETVESGAGTVTLSGSERTVTVVPAVADAAEYIRQDAGGYDLLVGAALLDIIDGVALPSLLAALDAGGAYYFPLTFDGATRFRPTHPEDGPIESAYHEHMDTKPGGNSQAGDAALACLQRTAGVTVDAAGSDWVVTADNGDYPADEAYFLSYILGTVERAVSEVRGGTDDALTAWLGARRDQHSAGELVYTTHQLDLFGRAEDPARFVQ
jgi:hypothetical protein